MTFRQEDHDLVAYAPAVGDIVQFSAPENPVFRLFLGKVRRVVDVDTFEVATLDSPGSTHYRSAGQLTLMSRRSKS